MDDHVVTPAPRLSVTVLNYNYGRYLPACLDSILNQSYRDFEVIVIDDCSTDGSLDAVQPYTADARLRVVAHTANRGYVASLIEGTEEYSRGEFLSVISADDLVRDAEAFELQIALLDAHKEAGFCFSHYDKVSGDRAEPLGTHQSQASDGTIDSAVALRRIIGDPMMRVLHSGTVIRRNAYQKAGGYRRDVRYAVDLAMWLSLSVRSDAGYIAKRLYAYRTHDSQMSGSLEGYRALMKETFRLVDDACADAGLSRTETAQRQRSASRSYLFGWAMDEAFHGARVMPLRRCAAAVRMRPRHALTSPQLWGILARVGLGKTGFECLRAVIRRLKQAVRPVGATRTPADALAQGDE